MRDLEAYALNCMEKLDKIGIEYGNVKAITVNTTAPRRWGQAKKILGGYSININQVLLDEKNDENGLINTILHELLHTCQNCWGHNAEWQRLAARVNAAYGYNIKRVSTADEKGIANANDLKKYQLQCVKCGKTFGRYKMCDLIKYPEFYACKCGGKLTRVK